MGARTWTNLAMGICAVIWLSLVATAAPQDSKSIASFVDCLSTEGDAGRVSTIADTVDACIPSGCRVIVTMSPTSAQKGCTLGGCLLPRVIFDCPGTADDLRFRPSYLLCPIDSKADGTFGVDRIEVGEDTEKIDFVNNTGKMEAADIPIPPVITTVHDVLSRLTKDNKKSNAKDSKGCNLCHQSANATSDKSGATALVRGIDPFGTDHILGARVDLASYVIDKSANVDKSLTPDGLKQIHTGLIKGDGTNIRNKTLDEICDCIENNKQAIRDQANGVNLPRGAPEHPVPGVPPKEINHNVDADGLLRLCRALAAKIDRVGVQGGGVFDDAGAESVLQLSLSGQPVSSSKTFALAGVHGGLDAFSHRTRTRITSATLSVLEGTLLENGDFHVAALGSAQVNGKTTAIQLKASHYHGSHVTFEISSSVTGDVLVTGTSADGRAALELTLLTPAK